ncbi:TetR family transcriptional regulator [Streptomyces acidicola]|uniref:TetR family transcriptional regulator n=1 Tax=Streptomyces acidicola TaxID=2596892 RepID=UPI003430A7F7
MTKTEASRRRLLDTAAREFAACGIAGARVDRISRESRVSKAQIYAYFAGKEDLFDAVLTDQTNAMVDLAPFSPHDLQAFAACLYDAYLTNPELVRLCAWARLERSPSGPLFLAEEHQTKIDAIAAAQEAGLVRSDLEAGDIFSLLVGMTLSWSPISFMYAASARDAAADHTRRKAALNEAVRALVLGSTSTSASSLVRP